MFLDISKAIASLGLVDFKQYNEVANFEIFESIQDHRLPKAFIVKPRRFCTLLGISIDVCSLLFYHIMNY